MGVEEFTALYKVYRVERAFPSLSKNVQRVLLEMYVRVCDGETEKQGENRCGAYKGFLFFEIFFSVFFLLFGCQFILLRDNYY